MSKPFSIYRSSCRYFFLLYLSVLSFAVQAEIRESLMVDLNKSVVAVKVAATAKSAPITYGTGFVIAKKGVVVTDLDFLKAHIVKKKGFNVYIQSSKEEWILSETLAIDFRNRLAVLHINASFEQAFVPENLSVKGASRVFLLGKAIDKKHELALVQLPPALQSQTGTSIYRVLTKIPDYFTGSPILNDQGQLVGVTTIRDRNGAEHVEIIDGTELSALVNKYKLDLQSDKENDRLSAERLRETYFKQAMIYSNVVRVKYMNTRLEGFLNGWTFLKVPFADCARLKQGISENYICDFAGESIFEDKIQAGKVYLQYAILDDPKASKRKHFTNAKMAMQAIHKREEHNSLYRAKKRCTYAVFNNKKGVPLKADYCLFESKILPALHALQVRITTMQFDRPPLVAYAFFEGFEFKNIELLSQAFINGMSTGVK